MSLATQTTPLIAALEQLGPHDHFCSIYESPQEHYAVAIPFIRIGLERGEKCIYIADDGAVEDVRQAMQSEGIDVEREISSKALVLATKDQTYLKHGAFHPDWMFTFWKETTELAMSEGFSALRATGETEWVLRGGRGLERWMEYESRLTHTLSESKCSALCQYNRRLFPPEVILDVIRTHPTIVYGGTVCRNLYYVPPEEFLGADQTAREVERLLTNIRERERVDNALREQLKERKRAEEELREQARLLDLTHDTVFSRRMDDEITYWNRGAEELYGWTREEAVGHVTHQLTQTIFPAPLEDINAELLRTGRWEGELVHTKRDGTQVVVASRWALQRDELGKPTAILETNNDITERKRAEEALRRSESYLADAQRFTHTGSWAFNAITPLYWSEENFRIWGFDPQQGLPAREAVLQRIHPEDRDRVVEYVQNAVRERRDYAVEFRIVLPDGAVRYIHGLGHTAFSASGELVEVVGTNVDVTESKRAEEALRRSERYLAEAQRLSHTGSWAFSANSKIAAYWSEEDFRIWGFDPQQGPPDRESVFKRIHPEDFGRVYEKSMKALRERTDYTDEFRIVLPDGEVRHIHALAHPVLSASGEIAEYVGTHVDVTERKRAEEAQLRLAAIVASSDDAIISKTLEGIITSWNAAAQRTFGYAAEEAVGRPITILIPPDRRYEESQIIERLRRGESVHHFETVRLTKNGREIHVSLAISPMKDADGQIIGASKIARDITERKRAEAEQKRAAEALRQAEADLAHVSRVTTMGELTASLAHEVNQPITAAVTNAKTCVRWLANDTPNLEEARDAALRSAKNGTRAAEIIGRIRLLFQKGTPQRELVDINEVIREIIVLLRSEATRYSISVRTELGIGLPELMGDSVQLQQVIMNLVLNGIEAMKDVDDKRELFIKSQLAEDEQLLISISDTGGGLPPQADHIFDAFFTTKLHGTGMGLSISRSIVESHGGRLWADGNSPRGATFHIALPTGVEAR
jgi:PAS domain S-box-containing protein